MPPGLQPGHVCEWETPRPRTGRCWGAPIRGHAPTTYGACPHRTNCPPRLSELGRSPCRSGAPQDAGQGAAAVAGPPSPTVQRPAGAGALCVSCRAQPEALASLCDFTTLCGPLCSVPRRPGSAGTRRGCLCHGVPARDSGCRGDLLHGSPLGSAHAPCQARRAGGGCSAASWSRLWTAGRGGGGLGGGGWGGRARPAMWENPGEARSGWEAKMGT